MRVLCLASLMLCFAALSLEAACPVVGGAVVPCARPRAEQHVVSHHERPLEHAPAARLATPLFTPEQVAPDVTPEHLALLNDPTWERAVDAAMVSLYRSLRALEATYLMDAARRSIVKDIEARYGLSQRDILPFLQAFARDWGLATADLTGVAPPTLVPGTDAEDTARILSAVMRQGQGGP